MTRDEIHAKAVRILEYPGSYSIEGLALVALAILELSRVLAAHSPPPDTPHE